MTRSILPLLFALLLVSLAAPLAATAQSRASTVPDTPYRLTAAYPNPFNAATTFDLSVERRQHVVVEVFNLLGQRVALLHDGVLAAGETYRFTFEAGNAPSGIYLYSVRGESFSETRQVTLLR